jgi:hypothetical protein
LFASSIFIGLVGVWGADEWMCEGEDDSEVLEIEGEGVVVDEALDEEWDGVGPVDDT